MPPWWGGSLFMGACSQADIMGAGTPKTDFGPFGAFLKVAPDNVVTVINKHQEMGQGNHAGLAALVAEELDADWSKVTTVLAGGNTKVYANTLMGVQGTGGSTAINNSWMQYRKAGGRRPGHVRAGRRRPVECGRRRDHREGRGGQAPLWQVGDVGRADPRRRQDHAPDQPRPEGDARLHPDRHRAGAPPRTRWPSPPARPATPRTFSCQACWSPWSPTAPSSAAS